VATVRLLLVDACVLIDFSTSDVSVLTLVSKHVGQVHVPSPVFDEVKQIDEAQAASLGLKVIDPPLEMLLEAGAKRGGRLSFQDRIYVLVAKAEGFTCVSNDRSVRSACEADGVPVLWGLELLVELVAARALPLESARDIAKQIVDANKRMDPTLYLALSEADWSQGIASERAFGPCPLTSRKPPALAQGSGPQSDACAARPDGWSR
jgi:hypothetical protein